MKKRMALITGMLIFLCMAVTGGCGKNEKPAEKSSETSVEKEQEEEKEEEKLAVIGTEAESENIYKITVENKTGKNIVGFSIKDSVMADYPANMLGEGDVYTVDEKRNLYYDSSSISETEPTEGEAEEKLPDPQIDVQLTFEDHTVLVLSAFPFGDVEECGIYVEDGVAFIKYKSVSSKENVSTKEAELAIKAAAEAEEQRLAEEAAEAEAQRQAEEEAAAEAQRQAEEAAAAEAQRQAEAAAAAEAQRQAEAAAAAEAQRQAEAAAAAEAAGDLDEGCVNDGLVY